MTNSSAPGGHEGPTGGPARRLRLFVAARVPRSRLEELHDRLEGLRARLPGARWVAPENQHVTLRFLGATRPDQLDAVRAVVRCAAARTAAAQLSLGGLGAFPRTSSARVLWAGVDDSGGALTEVAGRLRDELAPLGFEPERRAFAPHLTLARFKTPARLTDLPELAPGEPFGLEEVALYRSHLSPRGARYELVDTFLFQEGTKGARHDRCH